MMDGWLLSTIRFTDVLQLTFNFFLLYPPMCTIVREAGTNPGSPM